MSTNNNDWLQEKQELLIKLNEKEKTIETIKYKTKEFITKLKNEHSNNQLLLENQIKLYENENILQKTQINELKNEIIKTINISSNFIENNNILELKNNELLNKNNELINENNELMNKVSF